MSLIGQMVHDVVEKIETKKEDEEHGASLRLAKAIARTEYKPQLLKILEQGAADIEPDFLGFMETYEALARIVPKGRTIIDIGCAYGFQAFYFMEHKAYIGIDLASVPPHHDFFTTRNSTYYSEGIGAFLRDHPEVCNNPNVFAICNYNPMWGEHGSTEDVRLTFKNLYVFYPEHGDRPEIDDLADRTFLTRST